MKIAVMGAGALGCYFGGRLAAAGQEVWLVARGTHLEALKAGGLKIESPLGDLHLRQVNATASPAEVGPADVILFMVKNYDVEAAADALGPMIGPGTMVITCQNGVTAPQRLGDSIGAGRVLAGVVRMPADIRAPGIVRHPSRFDRIAFGEADGSRTERAERLVGLFGQADGITVDQPANMIHDLWAKFVMQATFSAMTCLARTDIGPLRDDPQSRRLMIAAMEETEQVGRAIVADLPEGLTGRALALLDRLPPATHSSMLDDLNNGKRIELDYLSGDVVRLGRSAEVPTPIHDVFLAALHPLRDGRP